MLYSFRNCLTVCRAPLAGSEGVVGTLTLQDLPSSSRATRSVKVPPISIPSLMGPGAVKRADLDLIPAILSRDRACAPLGVLYGRRSHILSSFVARLRSRSSSFFCWGLRRRAIFSLPKSPPLRRNRSFASSRSPYWIFFARSSSKVLNQTVNPSIRVETLPKDFSRNMSILRYPDLSSRAWHFTSLPSTALWISLLLAVNPFFDRAIARTSI